LKEINVFFKKTKFFLGDDKKEALTIKIVRA